LESITSYVSVRPAEMSGDFLIAQECKMYLFPEMIDDALGKPWPSSAHRVVAIKTLLGNRHYVQMSNLVHAVEVIAHIPKDKIKMVTDQDLAKLGIMID
jgi:hypothetical protein